MAQKSILYRLVSGGAFQGITLLLSMVVSFFLMPFIINALGDKWYGLWIIVGSLIGYFGFLDLGLSSASQRFIAQAIHSKDSKQVNIVYNSALAMFIAMAAASALLASITILLSPIFIENTDDIKTFQIIFAILGIKTALNFLFMVNNGVISAHLRYDVSSYINLFKLIVRTGLIVAYLSSGHSIIALATITVIIETTGYIIISYFAKKIEPSIGISPRKIEKGLCKELITYSKHSFIGKIGDLLRFKIDHLVIAQFINLTAVTHYSIAMRLIEYIGQLLGSVLNIFLPIFTKYHAQDDKSATREKFIITSEISLILSLLFVCTLVITGQSFIILWVGSDYVDAYLPLLVLAIASVTAGSSRMCITILMASAKHGYYAKINIWEGVANLILSIILIQYYGILGVALGTTIPTIINKLYLLPKYTCKELNLNLIAYYKLIGKHLMISVTIYLIAYNIYQNIVISNFFDIIIFSVCSTITYLSFTYVFLSPQLKLLLKKVIRLKFN